VSPVVGLISAARLDIRCLDEALSRFFLRGARSRLGFRMAAEYRSSAKSGGRPRMTTSRSPVKTGADDLAAGLSARMGDLMLTDKEATGLVIRQIGSSSVP
jgi:hypothetical protein